MEIFTDFCGGNAQILEQRAGHVRFTPELRDTTTDWFYWAFGVHGAAGQTVTFDCAPKKWIGRFGAAVSRDLVNWHWSGGCQNSGSTFTYTFASDDEVVYFAHNMLYHPSRFHRLCERYRIPVRILCEDAKGTPVPFVTLGDGEKTILLTARHHCCEATGNYIMEGMLEEFHRNPLPGWKIMAIPFMDADGVIAGDQGKNRAPHDHNRDYSENALYPAVRKVREILASGTVKAAFDLHSPWHQGGQNDKVFIVRNSYAQQEKLRRMGCYLMEEITPDAMHYDTADDVEPGFDWNKILPEPITYATHCMSFGTDIAFTLETAYFGTPANMVTQARLVETGRCFARAARRYCAEME